MIKQFSKNGLSLALAFTFPFLCISGVSAENISLKTMTKDITYLASDELKGRASFSPEIDIAANYISKRFKEIGLVPLASEKNFKQTFSVTNIMPNKLAVSLNGSAIDSSHLSMASTMASLHWKSNKEYSQHVVSEADNMRDVIREINQTGGKHVVFIHSAHAELFSRYKAYFARGLNKLTIDHEGAIIMVLTDETAFDLVDIEASTNINTNTLTNVVGVLPGTTKPNEIVLYSAHYDHLGEANTETGDKVYNGADDDASGTTAIINLAEYFSSQKSNNRTLMFSAFTAEEIGGFGSQYFSKQLNPDEVIAMINIEMIGKPSKFGAGQVWMTGMERSNLGELLNKSLSESVGKNVAKNGHNVIGKIHKDPYPEQHLFYRSDNATLARLGVPAHSFSSTQLDKDQHYHQVSDDLASLDLASMHQVIESLSIATKGLVDGSITPTRVDVSKVNGKGKIY